MPSAIDTGVTQDFLHFVQLLIEMVNMIQHQIDGIGDRVRHIGGRAVSIETDFLRHRIPPRLILLSFGIDNVRWNADHRDAGRHRFHHYRVRTHPGAVADFDRPNTLAPAPITTPLPKVGWRLPLSQLVPPSVTLW